MTTGVYLGGFPSSHFALPRSYYFQLSLLGDSGDVDQAGDTLTMYISRPLNYGIVYVLNPFVIPWSSNRYTLDYIVYDCWWFFGFDGVHHPQAYTVNYWQRGSPARDTLTIVQPLAGTIETFIPIDPPPPSYWLPPPL